MEKERKNRWRKNGKKGGNKRWKKRWKIKGVIKEEILSAGLADKDLAIKNFSKEKK
jgi:hypothetical protein